MTIDKGTQLHYGVFIASCGYDGAIVQTTMTEQEVECEDCLKRLDDNDE